MNYALPHQSSRNDTPMRPVELLISNLLRVGVVTSMLIVFIGTTISFLRHPDYLSNPPALSRLTTPGAAFPHTLHDVLRGVRDGRGQAIVMVGLLLLIATPVSRVAFMLIAFVIQRDRIYVAISELVLALLFYGLLLGRA